MKVHFSMLGKDRTNIFFERLLVEGKNQHLFEVKREGDLHGGGILRFLEFDSTQMEHLLRLDLPHGLGVLSDTFVVFGLSERL